MFGEPLLHRYASKSIFYYIVTNVLINLSDPCIGECLDLPNTRSRSCTSALSNGEPMASCSSLLCVDPCHFYSLRPFETGCIRKFG